MPNNTVRASAIGLPQNTESVAALTALWHEAEGALSRGPYPDHVLNLMVDWQDVLLRKIIDAPCATEQDLAAKLKFAAFIVESAWRGEKVETNFIGRVAADYGRLCREVVETVAAA